VTAARGAFEELKGRQSLMWGNGGFVRIEEISTAPYEDLVATLAPRPGERWLDVACGTGAVALRAARTGARVTGVDLAPALVETARRRADEQGLEVELEVGDCEALRYEDASFDLVSSSFGVMFAPDHRQTAAELARVCRPGGRLGLTTWRADSGFGEMFRAAARFQPPLPEGAGSPLDWGREDHVGDLLGDTFELDFHEGDARLEAESGEEVWQLFSTEFGPTKTLAESLDPERREDLRRTFVDAHERYRRDGRIDMERRYLLTRGVRRR
jgi:SAM-dependent methyltransferase